MDAFLTTALTMHLLENVANLCKNSQYAALDILKYWQYAAQMYRRLRRYRRRQRFLGRTEIRMTDQSKSLEYLSNLVFFPSLNTGSDLPHVHVLAD